MAVTTKNLISSTESSGQLAIPDSINASQYIFHVTISDDANVYLTWGINSVRTAQASDILTETGTIYYTGVSPVLNVEWDGNTGSVGVSYVVIDPFEMPLGGYKFRKVYASDMELGKNSGRYVRVYRSRRFPNK